MEQAFEAFAERNAAALEEELEALGVEPPEPDEAERDDDRPNDA